MNEEKSDDDLDKILKAYENEIPKLASDLKEKYNKTLEIVRESPPSPPASAQATKKKKRMVLSEDQHLAVRLCSHYFLSSCDNSNTNTHRHRYSISSTISNWVAVSRTRITSCFEV